MIIVEFLLEFFAEIIINLLVQFLFEIVLRLLGMALVFVYKVISWPILKIWTWTQK